MTAARRSPSPASGRFPRRVIGKRIDDLRVERGFEIKQLCDLIDWDKGEYSRKSRGITPISAEEAGRCAEILRAPRGWPYVTLEEGAILEALGANAADVLAHLRDILELIEKKRRPNSR